MTHFMRHQDCQESERKRQAGHQERRGRRHFGQPLNVISRKRRLVQRKIQSVASAHHRGTEEC